MPRGFHQTVHQGATHLHVAALLAVPRVGGLPLPHRLQRCTGSLQQGTLQ